MTILAGIGMGVMITMFFVLLPDYDETKKKLKKAEEDYKREVMKK